MRSSDSVTQVLDDIEYLSLLGFAGGLELSSEFLIAFLSAVRLGAVGLADENLALTAGSFLEIDQGADDRKDNANQPALACSSGHLLELKAGEELHLDEYGEIIENPVEPECNTGKNLQVLLEGWEFATTDDLNLDVFVECLEEAEKFTSDTHVSFKERRKRSD